MDKINAYRHGEILFVVIDKLPEGLKETKTKTILTGSSNNPHTFDNGKIYFSKVDDYVFGYFEAKNTTLKHIEHGEGKNKTAKLPDGVYELRRAVEKVNKELRQVVD